MNPKIAIVGAGGYIFPLMLAKDILSFPALQRSQFALYDIDLPRAEHTLEGVNGLIELHRLGADAFATDDPHKAFAGADFVICTFAVGGLDAYRADVEIPRRYGVDQPVGDTLGSGGVFRGLRSIAALREIASLMRELCPQALLIQYANPMSINCWATEAMGARTVGLCHSVQYTSRFLAGELDVPYDEVVFDCAGVNHTAWFTTFRRGEEDLLPRLREVLTQRYIRATGSDDNSDDLRAGGSERVRTELMQLTGFFHTESSHHASEYWAWFRKSPELVDRYLPLRWDFFEICSEHVPEDRNKEILDQSARDGLVPGEEFGAYIIDSMVTGTKRIIYGNVSNRGGIVSNLPDDCSVEVACLVDQNGVRPLRYGALPSACAALNNIQIGTQRLAVEAALTGDRDLVYAAVAIDPLTSAQLTLPEIRSMVDEMFAAQAPWLPQFDSAS